MFVIGGINAWYILGRRYTAFFSKSLKIVLVSALLGAAKLYVIDRAAWLKEFLEKLSVWADSRLDGLLPLAPEHIEALDQKYRWVVALDA